MMNENLLGSVYLIASIVAMIVTTIVAIISLVCSQRALTKQLKEASNRMMTQLQHDQELHQKQARVSFFAEYTRRYHDIVLNMPDNENDSKWFRYQRLYFDLCSEEFHLYKKGFIDDDVWKHWVEGMKDTLRIQSFRNAWTGRLGQNYYDQDFVHFMHQEVMNL